MRELKKYKLKPGRKPKQHTLLSGVAHVLEYDKTAYAYIQFDEAFVDAVGKALPHGLMPSKPAYLKLLHMPGRKTWRIFAQYLKQESGVLLWESPALPSWIGTLHQN